MNPGFYGISGIISFDDQLGLSEDNFKLTFTGHNTTHIGVKSVIGTLKFDRRILKFENIGIEFSILLY